MGFSQRLEIRQNQSLVMTPQLQQAIKLLQLSNMDLQAYVNEQVEKNPLLDLEDLERNKLSTSIEVLGKSSGSPAIDGDDGGEPASNDNEKFDRHGEREAFSRDLSQMTQGGAANFNGERPDIEATLSATPTLREHLLEQVQIAGLVGVEHALASYLIDCVDDAGYLTEDVGDIALRLGTDPDQVEGVLLRMQQFDPAGVFSRSLSECLSLQLRERNRLDPAMEAMLQNLERLAAGDLKGLTGLCGVSLEDVADMAEEIRALNPKPGLAFAYELAETVIPDIFVKRAPDGLWKIELNSDTLPKILLNNRYYAEVSRSAKGKDAKNFIADCYNEANWLVKSLDQRAKTILKVAAEIVEQQQGFLEHGIHHLKPLNLKMVADAIGMHESTVSRVTSNKYMATERGLFEMKYFFTSAIASSDGMGSHSAEAVRYRIKKLIDDESPDDVLSDDKIVEILRGVDIEIARRTVAKYRESMKIPSSVQRRRLKNRALEHR